jgi:hypothetical protein
MKARNIIIGAATLAVAAATAYAATVVTKTYRTTAYFVGIQQGTNDSNGHPSFQNASFAGHNLVNLAMGRSPAATNTPGQVLAMTFACDLSSASLVVYDEKLSNVVATIGQSTSIDSVVQQDNLAKAPNRAHFVTVLPLNANGNGTNGIASGYLTIAGRVNLDPVTGCPLPVRVILDHDTYDRLDDDVEISAKNDPDSVALLFRAGLAHAIGVADLVIDGDTNTVLVPYAGLSIRRELPEGSTVGTPTPASN